MKVILYMSDAEENVREIDIADVENYLSMIKGCNTMDSNGDEYKYSSHNYDAFTGSLEIIFAAIE